LRANGTVIGWGNNSSSQITVPSTATNVIAIAAGSLHSLALRADGTVIQWGTGLTSSPVPTNLNNVVAISAALTHNLALRADGTVVNWGSYYTGKADNTAPADVANVIQIASGGDRDMALFGTRAPAITIQPFSRTLFRGSNTTFTAKAVAPPNGTASYQWRFNGVDIPGATTDSLVRTNLQFTNAGAYQLVVSNSYGVAVSKPAKLAVTLPLPDSLDLTAVTWVATNIAPWFGQAAVTHDGVDAAQSGSIGNGQETILQTTLTGPATGSFWWKISSEAGFDFLEFKIDGVTQSSISGEANWAQVSYSIASGSHTLAWRYSKDGSGSAGTDAGWVDQFVYIPSPPTITSQPVSQTVFYGSNVTFSVSAVGIGPLTYQWLKNGTNAGLPAASSMTLNNVSRAARGAYSCVVSNLGGATPSSNAVLYVLVPQKFGTPTLLPDGSVFFYSFDADFGYIPDSDLAGFELLASTNLSNWVTVPNAISVSGGILYIQDPQQGNYPARFYRIVEH
jgi:hypothetical protein